MLKFFKRQGPPERITCPNCLVEQEVHRSALSIYCSNCRSRIDTKAVKQNVHENLPPQQWKPKTKSVSCPFCHSLQEVLATAISAYCKSCNQRIPVQEETQTEFNETVSVGNQKEIACQHCGNQVKVPSTALSSFCTECGNRINLQNYEIRGRFRGNLDTKGCVYIANDGVVEGNINTGVLIVSGRFKGEIIAEEKVEFKSTAKLYGKVRAPALISSSGAIFVGHLHIGK